MAHSEAAGGRSRTGSEEGFSLPEVLVTILIVGIAFAAILGGMMTAITVSDLHRKQATADTLVRDAAELVKDVARYDECGTGLYQQALAPLVIPTGFNPPVVQVDVWDGAVPSAGAPYLVGFPGPCGPTRPDLGLQRVTIAISSTDGRVTETVQVLKRRAGS